MLPVVSPPALPPEPSESREPARKIIHLDMDCFYAAVELRERPELAGLPVAVGGGSRRGVVTTCNYEARRFGVHSAMPGFLARERCPQLIFLPVRFDLYRAESQKIRAILHAHTRLIEPLSLDEAFLDVSATGRFAWDIAKEIRARIRDELHLTASAGIAANKMLAKIASEWRKPDGQFAILPRDVAPFMHDLPVRKVWGIGPKSADRFAARGIHTCGHLQRLTLREMIAHHGKWGEQLYRLCRGLDDRPVQPNRPRKSLSNENTFADNLATLPACAAALIPLAEDLLTELRETAPHRPIRKAFIKIKYADFSRTTHECLCAHPTIDTFLHLLHAAHARKTLPIRLLGTGIRFAEETSATAAEQLDLFVDDCP